MARTFVQGLLILASLLPLGCGSDRAADAASAKRQQALDAAGKEDWDATIKLSGEAIQLDAKNPSAWWLRGLAHLKKKEHAKAEADCTEAIKLDPNEAPAYRERGLARLGLQKNPQAIEDFTNYIRLRPDDAEGYEWRALAHSKNGDNKSASADLRSAEKLKGAKK